MNTNIFLSEVNSYLSFDKQEEHNRLRTISFLKEADQNSKSHLTVSAWIINSDNTRILFTHHKKYNEWYPLGGHVEKEDNTIFDASLREAREESGLRNLIPVFDKKIFDISIHDGCQTTYNQASLHFDITYCFKNQDHQEPKKITSHLNLSGFLLMK
jgi:8-oxo-dGTP pyrophosphatase MutT (NUDIX family)